MTSNNPYKLKSNSSLRYEHGQSLSTDAATDKTNTSFFSRFPDALRNEQNLRVLVTLLDKQTNMFTGEHLGAEKNKS